MGELGNGSMKQGDIQDFLNVPGIVGLALMDGLTSPYFHGFDGTCDATQQSAIAQSIQQVLETTPEGFNSFEFQFDHCRVYLYKLNRGMTLLVLTSNQLPTSAYTQVIRRLLIELQIDQADPIAALRSLAAGLPLAPQTLSQTLTSAISPVIQAIEQISVHAPHAPHAPELSSPQRSEQLPPQTQPPTQRRLEKISKRPTEPGRKQAPYQQSSYSQSSHSQSSHSKPSDAKYRQVLPSAPMDRQIASRSVNLKDVLAAINALSQLTAKYLGTLMVANYWKATRPAEAWLNHFQVERSAQLTFTVQTPSERLPRLTPEQHQCLQSWVAAFVEQCSKVMRNFTKLVQEALDEQHRALLFRRLID